MKNHLIFTILDNFDLLKTKGRLDKILHLSPSDFSQLLMKLAQSYPVKNEPEPNLHPFDINLPYPSRDILDHMASYSFLFDKVYVVDPLYDCCSLLAERETDNPSYVLRIIEETKQSYQDRFGEMPPKWFNEYVNRMPQMASNFSNLELYHQFRLVKAKELDYTIEKYLSYKELIQEGVLIPYVNMEVDYSQELSIVPLFLRSLLSQELDEKFSQNPAPLEDLKETSNSDSVDFVKTFDKFAKSYDFLDTYSLAMELGGYLATTLKLKTLFPADTSPNIDFGDKKNMMLLDKLIKILGDVAENGNNSLTGIQWPNPEHEVLFPVLAKIPSQELLSIRLKEKAALDRFRYNIQKRLMDIRSAIGSENYLNIIRSWQAEQRAQISEVELLSEHIQKNHLRKITYQASMITFSAAAAILSALSATKDPITLIGVGLGGAGASSGISSLIDTWISYKSEMDKLREKDGYILWKLHVHK